MQLPCAVRAQYLVVTVGDAMGFEHVLQLKVLLGTNGSCMAQSVVSVISDANFPIITVSSNTLITLGAQTTLTLTSSATNYTWSVASQTTAAISVTPGISQVYNVVGTNSLGCSTSSNIAILFLYLLALNLKQLRLDLRANQILEISNIYSKPSSIRINDPLDKNSINRS